MSLEHIPALPGARPFFGHSTEFTSNRLEFLTQIANEVKSVASLRFPTRDVLVVNSPETVHEVLVSKARSFEKSPLIRFALDPLAGRGLFTSEGALWRRQRRLMAPVFHQARIDALAPAMVACAERACQGLRDGEVRNIAKDTTGIAMSVAGRTLFDIDTLGEADEIGSALTTALQWTDGASSSLATGLQIELQLALGGAARVPAALRPLLERVSARLASPILWPTRRNRELRRAIALLDASVQRMLEKRRAAAHPGDDLLTHLLRARDQDDGSLMDDKQLRDEILTLFVAGHETTANGLAWAIYLLAKHPEQYARARSAVDALGGRRPTLADLPRLEYLTRVFKEALRIYPPVYVFSRMSIADVEVGGHAIPRNTVVLISPFTLQRRSDLWPDPLRFDPDRFSASATPPEDAWIPFSDGPRICIGMHFAMIEAPLVLATMLQHADFELEGDREVQPDESSPTLRPRGGVPVRIRLGSSPRGPHPGEDDTPRDLPGPREHATAPME
jgi:cytochrome P450